MAAHTLKVAAESAEIRPFRHTVREATSLVKPFKRPVRGATGPRKAYATADARHHQAFAGLRNAWCATPPGL